MSGHDKRYRDLAHLGLRQGGWWTSSQGRDVGLGDRTVRNQAEAGRWERVLKRIYGPSGVPLTWERCVHAALLGLDGGGALSHGTAAAVHGLRAYRRTLPIHVVVPYGRSVRLEANADWLDLHRSRTFTSANATDLDGLTVTTVPRTIVDLSPEVSLRRHREIVFNALRRQLTTLDELYAAAEAAGRLRNAKRLYNMLGTLDPQLTRARSDDEGLLLDLILKAGLPRPVVNYEVLAENGAVLFEIDVAYPWWRLGYESDSDTYHSLPEQVRKDRRRDRRLHKREWIIDHFSAHEIRHTPRAVAREIADDIERAKQRTGIWSRPSQ